MLSFCDPAPRSNRTAASSLFKLRSENSQLGVFFPFSLLSSWGFSSISRSVVLRVSGVRVVLLDCTNTFEQLCGFNECLLGIIVDRLLSVISITRLDASSHSTSRSQPLSACCWLCSFLMGSWVPIPGCSFTGSRVPFPGCLFMGSRIPVPGCLTFFTAVWRMFHTTFDLLLDLIFRLALTLRHFAHGVRL